MNLRKDHYRLPTGPRDAGRRLVALFRLRTPRGSSRPGGPSLGVAVVGGWRRRRASGLPLLRVREAFRAYVRFLPSASPSGFLRAGLSRGTASPSRWRRGLPVGVCGPFPKPPHPLSGGGKGAEGAGGGPLRWASRSAGGASCLSNTPERVPGVVLLSAPVSPCSPRGLAEVGGRPAGSSPWSGPGLRPDALCAPSPLHPRHAPRSACSEG